ncbi:hypothetical protein [Flavihumibacter profundi]|uniref:hypothetical protein n=1 Tax=Flavihumibacter profundi TaxID=2716883 RepID=UPI001CC76A3F|nr:hypothetical protein [Flavihumibacter profundi]MBZ5855540.1 hypothetical protein [Flavihumibacter profundi]
MKKLLLVFTMLTGLFSFTFAQTPAVTATHEVKPATTKAAEPKAAATKAPAAKPAEKPSAAAGSTPSTGVVLKKDGTPDKRYKNSQEPAGPVKKDGTPDKRYKANKKQ